MLILFNVKVKCKSTHDWVLMIRITPGQGRTFWYLDTFKPEHVVISCLVYTNASVYWLRLSAHSWRHLCSNIILDRFTRTFYGFMNTLCLIILTERLQLYSYNRIYFRSKYTVDDTLATHSCLQEILHFSRACFINIAYIQYYRNSLHKLA